MSNERRGFTLLEVLAAVALLGMVYTVLGQAGIQGLQHEGEANRRVGASLLADQVLEEIEAGLEAGVALPIGSEENESEIYSVVTEVAALDLVLPADEQAEQALDAGDRPRRPGQSRRDARGGGTSFLAGGPGGPSPLRRIDVRVTWIEGFGERSVVRTTYGIDREAIGEGLAQLEAEAGGPGGEEASGLGGRRDAGEAPPAPADEERRFGRTPRGR